MSFEIRNGTLKRWLPENSETKALIPDEVKEIGQGAFKDCVLLEYVELPESVESISPYAFKGCTALESVVIPESVSMIGG